MQESQAAFAAAQEVIPGGVNSPARAFGAVGGTPPFISHGEGAHIFDIDGKRYIDFQNGWATNPLGNCHPEILEVVDAATLSGMEHSGLLVPRTMPTRREAVKAECNARWRQTSSTAPPSAFHVRNPPGMCATSAMPFSFAISTASVDRSPTAQ